MKKEIKEKNYEKIEHLKMIQSIIKRMGRNSFFMKGMVLTMAGPAMYFNLQFVSINLELFMFFSIFIIILLVFVWWLDVFFLRQERLYRKLYDEFRMKKNEEIDFSMNTSKFQCKEHKFWKKRKLINKKCWLKTTHWLNVFFSATLVFFYLLFLIFWISAFIIIKILIF